MIEELNWKGEFVWHPLFRWYALDYTYSMRVAHIMIKGQKTPDWSQFYVKKICPDWFIQSHPIQRIENLILCRTPHMERVYDTIFKSFFTKSDFAIWKRSGRPERFFKCTCFYVFWRFQNSVTFSNFKIPFFWKNCL